MSFKYTYNGKKVIVPRGAEVAGIFGTRPGAPFQELVQETLNAVDPWEAGQDPIETFSLPVAIGARVVALATSEVPLWGVNPHHRARTPGVSPYAIIDRRDSRGSTTTATLELAGTPDKPVLTRVYPGEYMPPLPWMSTAKNAPGRMRECVEYWSTHAYIFKNNDTIPLSPEAPDWYVPPVQPDQI